MEHALNKDAVAAAAAAVANHYEALETRPDLMPKLHSAFLDEMKQRVAQAKDDPKVLQDYRDVLNNKIDLTNMLAHLHTALVEEFAKRKKLEKESAGSVSTALTEAESAKVAFNAIQMMKALFAWIKRFIQKCAQLLGFNATMPEKPTDDQLAGRDGTQAELAPGQPGNGAKLAPGDTPTSATENLASPTGAPDISPTTDLDVKTETVNLTPVTPLALTDQSAKVSGGANFEAMKGTILSQTQTLASHFEEVASTLKVEAETGTLDFTSITKELTELADFRDVYLSLADSMERDLNLAIQTKADAIKIDFQFLKDSLLNPNSGAGTLLAGDGLKDFQDQNEVIIHFRQSAERANLMAMTLVESAVDSLKDNHSPWVRTRIEDIQALYGNRFVSTTANKQPTLTTLDNSIAREAIIAQTTKAQTNSNEEANSNFSESEPEIDRETLHRAGESVILQGAFSGLSRGTLPPNPLEDLVGQALELAKERLVEDEGAHNVEMKMAA